MARKRYKPEEIVAKLRQVSADMITAAEFRHGCCGQGTQVEIRWWSSPWWQLPLQCGQRGHSVVVPGWLQLGVSNCPFVTPTGVSSPSRHSTFVAD